MIAEEDFFKARIMIVDDELTNARLLERMLQRKGYTNLQIVTDSREVIPRYIELRPDLILLDLLMPYMDGYAVLEQLTPLIGSDTYVPILVLTADITLHARQRALASGANDFLTKPLNATEVLLRIHNLLETRLLYLELQQQNQKLEEHVRQRTLELQEAQREILQRLARAAEFREENSSDHPQQVGQLAEQLARALGRGVRDVEMIGMAAPLHDLGMIGIPDDLLLKPGQLSSNESAVLQAHTAIGAGILAGSRFPLLRMAEEIAIAHHEHWDGSGYPNRLRGSEIPWPARIVSIVDAYCAMTRAKRYRPAMDHSQALSEIERYAGTQFDPEYVAAFVQMMHSTTPP
ncbi:MAG TPA: response regulator [Roseiflexaceae bacterium]|nr:response regulator [Roseiflexaceae bacterium]HMP38964.1 response regulator [Roseiflexaceae bacterium]